MNANELIDLGNELTRLNSDHLAQKCVDDNDVQNYIYDSMDILERSRIRETATEPPTREDAQSCECGCDSRWVLAVKIGVNRFVEVPFDSVCKSPNYYPFWTQFPQLPEVTP